MARAKRSLGQNFLVDTGVQDRIVQALDLHTDDDVFEIGPGRGALTLRIAGHVRHLFAVELDDTLAATLQNTFSGDESVSIIHANALDIDAATLVHDVSTLKVVGNIPYNITSPLIFHLLARERRPSFIVIMVQKEVAQRIAAAPGSGEYGALSVGVQSVATVERLFHVGRGAFRPVPNVDSTVLRITPVRPFPLDAREEADLRSLTHAAFQWRRKQLQKTLRASPAYSLDAASVHEIQAETGIDLERRPETLSPHDLLRLSRALRRRDHGSR